jgi:recombination protein RecA
MLPARADLESLLRARKLDRTLASFSADPRTSGITDEYATAPSGITTLDARLGGGFPRGQISEMVGPRSSGRTSLLLRTLAAATRRRELVALIDVLDRLDVASADAAGIELDRLLWIRGQMMPHLSSSRDLNDRALDRAIKAITLVLQAGNFGMVVFDAAEAPPHALQRLPFTTWRRLHRIIEGSQTVCVICAESSIARSSGGITVRVGRAAGAAGKPGRVRADGQLFAGFDIEIEVVRAHGRVHEDVRVPLSTLCW